MESLVVWLVVAVVLLLAALAAAIAFSRPGRPPPLRTVVDALGDIDRALSGLPAKSTFRARDGAELSYRAYPGSAARVAVLVHGSAVSGRTMHPLAAALNRAGATVYALDLRGHGGRGTRGDVAYIGQLEDDVADFLAALGPPPPGVKRVLVGFSSGGGFVLRFAGSGYRDGFDGYLLLTPFLSPTAPTVRPEGGWVSLALPRVIGLTLLGRVGLHSFDRLSSVGFALGPEQIADREFAPDYSFRMMSNFGPHADWQADLRSVTRPMRILIGSNDEIFYADRLAAVVQAVRPDIPVEVVTGPNHAGLTYLPAGTAAAVAAFAALAGGH